MFIAGLCYASQNLTDGHLPTAAIPLVAAMAEVEPSVADHLATVGLWETVPAGYDIVDYLTFNPSRERVLAERNAAAERQRRSRAQSRRDSHESSDAPVPVPTTDPVNRPLATHEADTNADDDGNVPAAVWKHYADLKLPLEAPGTIRSPEAWKRTCARNARTELGPQAATWWHMFDIEPYRLAQALIDGQAPRYATRRNGDS